jgi:hypothetical protein
MPLNAAADLLFIPATDFHFSLPEPPPFRAPRNRFWQLFCVMASSFRKLFSSRDISGAALN